MKLNLMFVPLEKCIHKKVSYTLLLGSFGFIMFGGWLIYDTRLLQEMLVINTLTSKKPNNSHVVKLPHLSEIEYAAEEVELINQLLEGYPKHLSSLLYYFESVLPSQAFLTSLSYNKRTFEVKMEVRAKQEKLLRLFVADLEKLPDIKEVSYEKGGADSAKKMAVAKIRLRLLR